MYPTKLLTDVKDPHVVCLYDSDGNIVGNGFRMYNHCLVTAMHVSDLAYEAGKPGGIMRIRLDEPRSFPGFDIAVYKID